LDQRVLNLLFLLINTSTNMKKETNTMILKSVCFLFLACLLSYQTSAQWKLVKERNNVLVYTKKGGSSSFVDIKLISTIDGQLAPVKPVFNDVVNYPEWIHQFYDSERLEMDENGDFIFYAKINLPWPVKDRDVVLNVETIETDRSVEFVSTSRSTAREEEDCCTRIKDFTNRWVFEEVEDGKIKITYFASMDPGGAIPPMIYNMVAVDSPMNTMMNLREMLSKKEQ
ncbi:MAG: START domain-containing protein, partial [Bacteroidota bacterium]